MIPVIDLDTARRRRWDVIIAGSSFAAMFFAHALRDGLSVLFVEKGGVQRHGDLLRDRFAPSERIAQIAASGHEKTSRAACSAAIPIAGRPAPRG